MPRPPAVPSVPSGSPTLCPQTSPSSHSSCLSSGVPATLTPWRGLLNSETHPAAGDQQVPGARLPCAVFQAFGSGDPGCRCQAAVVCMWSVVLRLLGRAQPGGSTRPPLAHLGDRTLPGGVCVPGSGTRQVPGPAQEGLHQESHWSVGEAGRGCSGTPCALGCLAPPLTQPAKPWLRGLLVQVWPDRVGRAPSSLKRGPFSLSFDLPSKQGLARGAPAGLGDGLGAEAGRGRAEDKLEDSPEGVSWAMSASLTQEWRLHPRASGPSGVRGPQGPAYVGLEAGT